MSNWRINLFLVLVLLIAGGIGYRLFYLAQKVGPGLRQAAAAQYVSRGESTLHRGDIFIGDLSTGETTLAATTKDFPYIYIIPKAVTDLAATRRIMVEALGVEAAMADNILGQTTDQFAVLVKNPTPAQVQLVQGLNSPVIKIAYEPRRYYPWSENLAQVTGFVGYDSAGHKTGQYGVEAFYNAELSGQAGADQPGVGAGPKSGGDLGRWFSSWLAPKTESALSGAAASNLVLTVDKNIQTYAVQQLSELIKKLQAPTGSIIVEDPSTGAILALAVSPSFDPNNYQNAKLAQFSNPDLQSSFEPGSTFKAITMSGALDKKVLTPDSTYTDTGAVGIAGYTIKNFNEKSFGLETMTQVLEKSLNTGAIYMEEQLGDDNFLNYVLNFGFGQATGIDLAGEIGGDISNLYSKRKINFLTAAFGQGIAVTPLQLINAYSAIANGGKLMRPHIIKAMAQADGSQTLVNPEIISTPISERSAATISKMLVDVVDHGFDKVRVKGYDVAGKTGTAQIASPEGGYSDQFNHDMVAFAPAFAPKFVVLIKIDKPQGIKFAADSLSPTMGKMVRFLLNYFNVAPTRE